MGTFDTRVSRALEQIRLSSFDYSAWVRILLPARSMRSQALNAAGRRLSESRMRENLTYGSRWQGMETRIWCGQLRHSQRKQRVNRLPRLSLRRHPLTLPAEWRDRCSFDLFRLVKAFAWPATR